MRQYNGGPTVYRKNCVVSYQAICQHLDERYISTRKTADRHVVEARKVVKAILAANGGKVTQSALNRAMTRVYAQKSVGGGNTTTALDGYLARHGRKYAEE